MNHKRSSRRSLATVARGAAALPLLLTALPGISRPAWAADGRFVNLSTRALVETGDEVMIGGFIIRDNARRTLIQALGPELADRGISNFLADPVLTITNTTDPGNHIEIMVNDNWEDDDEHRQWISDLWGDDLPLAAGSLSSAALLTLDPGDYTAKVEGKDGTAGVAIVEVYRIDSPNADGEFVNLSTRALVETGDEVMIGGFILRDGMRRTLVQALGPELADRGISNFLADPVLTITNTTNPDNHIEIMVNDNWEDDDKLRQEVSDIWGNDLPLAAGSLSSTALLTLEPGDYTAKVEGKDGTAGVAIVEVYRIDSPGAGGSDREALIALYNATDGANWTERENWLSDAPLHEWYGVGTDAQGRVVGLWLHRNQLKGPLPAELGNLANLEDLWLYRNELSGPIPAELGNLTNLVELRLNDNQLSGPVPAELGNLANLGKLFLDNNQLNGPIPAELGNLANLVELFLNNNQLSGPIPESFLKLIHLTSFSTDAVNCVADTAAFTEWLDKIPKGRVARCGLSLPLANLTQATQSREFPVPLVAGEKALLRVFPTAASENSAYIPEIRARFYRDGQEVHVENIPGKSIYIPTEIDEGNLEKSANAEIPGNILQPGLEMVIEVDPNETLDASLGVPTRIPQTGRLSMDVRAMPPFNLTLIPFIWRESTDRSIVDRVNEVVADQENHELLWPTRTLLPIKELIVTAHEPVETSASTAFQLLDETRAIRAMENGTGYYMGMMSENDRNRLDDSISGIAGIPGRASFIVLPDPFVIAHELGHNLSLRHSPCGATDFLDFGYPYSEGNIGAWGYDFRNGGRLVPPYAWDLMSYCYDDDPRQWISDYNFSKALNFRSNDPSNAPATQGILTWGGVGHDGVPFLEPAFVVDASPALPDSAGPYRITGRTTSGVELFSLGFNMTEAACGDGRSSFAFVIPAQPTWEGNPASITLTGPGGFARLDGNSNLPISILRNPLTGQVRGILRGSAFEAEARAFEGEALVPADGAEQRAAGFEALFSRGIPGRRSVEALSQSAHLFGGRPSCPSMFKLRSSPYVPKHGLCLFLNLIVLALPGLWGTDHLSLVWSDEFEYTGLPDAGKWGYNVGGHGWGNRELQYYTQYREANARVENGVLVIEARREAFGGRSYTSARLISKDKGDWKYGRFEIRAKLPRGRGTWPAIWMLPTDWVYGGWPDSGEIDIMEHVGYNMQHIHGSIHTKRFNHLQGTQISSSLLARNVDTEFHVYAMEWRPDRIDIFLDGKRYFTVSNDGSGFEAWPFDQRFHLLMNIAVGGNWGGVQGVDNSIFPQRMEIDFVRVYAFEDFEHPTFHNVPGRIEAEDFSDQSGIRLEETRDVGGGSNAGYLENGDWAEYPLDVTIPGRYAFDLRYASQNGTAGIEIYVNGEIVETFQSFTSTGYWQNWETQRLTELELPKGKITLRISALAPPQQSALNYNWLDVLLLKPTALAEPLADPDGDGINNFFEYAFALNPSENTSQELLPFGYTVKKPNGTYVGITYRQRIGGTGRTGIDYSAAAVTYRVEVSGNLAEDSWDSVSSLLHPIGIPRQNGDGTETVSVEFAFPIDVGRLFLRLKLIAEDLN